MQIGASGAGTFFILTYLFLLVGNQSKDTMIPYGRNLREVWRVAGWDVLLLPMSRKRYVAEVLFQTNDKLAQCSLAFRVCAWPTLTMIPLPIDSRLNMVNRKAPFLKYFAHPSLALAFPPEVPF